MKENTIMPVCWNKSKPKMTYGQVRKQSKGFIEQYIEKPLG
jgi:hypothetical protein